MSFKAGLKHVLRHCWLWPIQSCSFPRSSVGTGVSALLGHRAERRSGQTLVPTPERGNQNKARHFGMDAEIQRPGMAIYELGWQPNRAYAYPSRYRPWPGYRHPCRYDGVFGSAGLVYNGEHPCVGIAIPTFLNHAADRRRGQTLVPTRERGNQKKRGKS